MIYDDLNEIYDIYTDGFNYFDYLEKIFENFKLELKKEENLVLDCGCGTGSLLLELYKRGYDCTGVDCSESMLEKAKEKLETAGYSPHLVCQDLIDLDLFGAYNLIFCTLDTINHFTDKRKLKKFINNLYNFTEPGGYFVFDVKTLTGFKKIKKIQIIERETGHGNTAIENYLLMHSSFSGTNAWYDITLFRTSQKVINDLEENNITDNNITFDKFQTYIEERYYTPKELKDILSEARFTFIDRINYKNRQIFAFKRVK